MQEMELLGVRVEMPANAPMVLLRERDGGDDDDAVEVARVHHLRATQATTDAARRTGGQAQETARG